MIKLQSIKKERKARVISIDRDVNAIEQIFNRYVEKYLIEPNKTKLLAAYGFVKQIGNQPVLSNFEYYAHAIRVTCLAMQLTPLVDIDTLIIALLHNTMEIANLKFEGLKKRFNNRIAESIKLLTLNRAFKKSQKYKILYYKRLNASFRGVRIIKVLDKLDNLFLLNTNPEDKTREMYLKEIEDYVIPIVDRDLKGLSNYYRKLVKNCRKVGCLDINKI